MGSELTRDHVIWAYRILLDRDPENDAVVAAKQAGYQSTKQLRADIVTSAEYADKNPDFAATNTRTVVIKELDGGVRLFVDLSDHAICLRIVRNDFEREELAFIASIVKPGDNVLDIGANVGFFAVQMAAMVGPAGTVTAFEPFEENADLLERSIAENRFEMRLRLKRAAVSKSTGVAHITFAPGALNSGGAYLAGGSVPHGHAVRTVAVTTLDEASIPRPVSFVKMDAEGAEALVLEGGARMIAADRPGILSELHPEQLQRVSGVSGEDFLQQARTLGYRAYRIDGGIRGAELREPPPEAVLSIALIPDEHPLARLPGSATINREKNN
jgi:FkbM family methyltransferase